MAQLNIERAKIIFKCQRRNGFAHFSPEFFKAPCGATNRGNLTFLTNGVSDLNLKRFSKTQARVTNDQRM